MFAQDDDYLLIPVGLRRYPVAKEVPCGQQLQGHICVQETSTPSH